MAINIHNAEFIISAVKSSQFPSDNLPEIVFVGRSNVGKSSILNALLNRKNLAYVGNTPGKTREINFFKIDNQLYFVDLPGYSFANMPKEKMAKISGTIDSYLKSRKNIALVVMLVDIRHKPTKDDKLMYDYLINSELDFIIVPTKADKIAVTKVPDYCNVIKEELNVPEEIDIIPISSTKKSNLETIWQVISEIL
ncbi:MAG: YihA family ribosome biogenesis GTP-binding protein [Clostridiales bacterium]|nr:YihA family ribosome biogenesis GTP-binding protein [Clostridiales bacterium]